MLAKDILGKTVNIGDIVAFNKPYYKGVQLGIIKKVNKKMFEVSLLTLINENRYKIESGPSYKKVGSVALLNKNDIVITNDFTI